MQDALNQINAMKVVIAQSEDPDPSIAAENIIKHCRNQLEGNIPRGALIWMGVDIDHQIILDAVMTEWKDISLAGCTTDGEFSSHIGYRQDSILLILLCSDEIEITSGILQLDADNNPVEPIESYLKNRKSHPDLCILFPDGMTFNSEIALSIMKSALGKTQLMGGLAADQWRLEETRQFFGKEISTNSTPFLLLSGPFVFSLGVDTGWKSIGEAGIVTKSEGNTVYEINKKPALEFYHEFLGIRAYPTGEMPMAVYDTQDNYKFLRTCFEEYNKETGAITFLGNITEGDKVRLTIVDRESIISGASVSLEKALKTFPADREPALALCFSCGARRAILGSWAEKEFITMQNRLGKSFPIAGFYTYGEICPPNTGRSSELHNESFAVLLLG